MSNVCVRMSGEIYSPPIGRPCYPAECCLLISCFPEYDTQVPYGTYDARLSRAIPGCCGHMHGQADPIIGCMSSCSDGKAGAQVSDSRMGRQKPYGNQEPRRSAQQPDGRRAGDPMNLSALAPGTSQSPTGRR